MDDILVTVKNAKESMTKLQQAVANQVLQDPMFAAFTTVHQLSNAIGVSTATITRFANTLGFANGYSAFQLELQNYLHLRNNPSLRLEKSALSSVRKDSIAGKIYELQLRNLSNTFNRNLEEQLTLATNVLINAKRIYACGSRGSYSIAYYLGHHLNRVFGNVDILSDEIRLPDYISRIQPNDAWIVVNLPRYSKRLHAATKIAYSKGATVISITDSLASPYAKTSHITLQAVHHSSDFHNSMLAPMLVAEMLLSLIFANDLPAVTQSLKNIEPIFAKLDTFTNE